MSFVKKGKTEHTERLIPLIHKTISGKIALLAKITPLPSLLCLCWAAPNEISGGERSDICKHLDEDWIHRTIFYLQAPTDSYWDMICYSWQINRKRENWLHEVIRSSGSWREKRRLTESGVRARRREGRGALFVRRREAPGPWPSTPTSPLSWPPTCALSCFMKRREGDPATSSFH